jgi:hypothetical protein
MSLKTPRQRGSLAVTGGTLACVALALLRPSRWGIVGLAWITAAFVGAVIGARKEAHYVLIAWPAQALALGLACELALPAEAAAKAWRLFGGVVVAFRVLGGIWSTHYLPGRHSTPAQNDDVHIIARCIAAAAQPGDALFVEDEPFNIYTFAGLSPATRFIYWNAPHPDAIATRQADVERLPAFVVLTPRTYEYVRTGTLPPNDAVFPPFAAVMHAEYREWVTTRSGTIYLRKNQPPPLPAVDGRAEPEASTNARWKAGKTVGSRCENSTRAPGTRASSASRAAVSS